MSLKIPTPPQKEKKAKIWATSQKLFICFQDCIEFKKSPENFSGIFYQMDHIWWSPSRLKKSPGFKIKSQWSFTLCRSLIMTLYTPELTASFIGLINSLKLAGVSVWCGVSDVFCFVTRNRKIMTPRHRHNCSRSRINCEARAVIITLEFICRETAVSKIQTFKRMESSKWSVSHPIMSDRVCGRRWVTTRA